MAESASTPSSDHPPLDRIYAEHVSSVGGHQRFLVERISCAETCFEQAPVG